MGSSPTTSLVDHLLGGLSTRATRRSTWTRRTTASRRHQVNKTSTQLFNRTKRIRSRDVHVTFCFCIDDDTHVVVHVDVIHRDYSRVINKSGKKKSSLDPQSTLRYDQRYAQCHAHSSVQFWQFRCRSGTTSSSSSAPSRESTNKYGRQRGRKVMG